MRHSRNRPVWLWAPILVVGSVLVALLLVELALHLEIVPNPLSERLATLEPSEPPSARVLVIGDSFVYKGGELDSLLGQALVQKGAQVRNVAVPGAGPLHYLAAFRAFAPRFDPDVVLVGLFAGNDISDLMFHPDYSSSSRRSWLRAWLRPYLWRSHLYSFYAAARARRAQARATSEVKQDLLPEVDPVLVEMAQAGQVNPGLLSLPPDRKKLYFKENLLLETPESRRAFDELTVILDTIAAQSRRRSAVLVVAVFPETTQVNDSSFDFYRRAGFTIDEKTLGSAELQAELRRWADDSGIVLIDLLPLFQQHADEDLYLQFDVHFNARGNALAAGEITKALAAIVEQ